MKKIPELEALVLTSDNQIGRPVYEVVTAYQKAIKAGLEHPFLWCNYAERIGEIVELFRKYGIEQFYTYDTLIDCLVKYQDAGCNFGRVVTLPVKSYDRRKNRLALEVFINPKN